MIAERKRESWELSAIQCSRERERATPTEREREGLHYKPSCPLPVVIARLGGVSDCGKVRALEVTGWRIGWGAVW